MATHYTSTTQTVKVKDYAYGGSSWAEISLAVTIAANGAVSYTASCNHSASGQWQYKGLIITLNGTTIANNNYYSSASECEAHFGKGSRFPINDDSSYSGKAGTASGGSVSYTLKLNCQSDGGVHGWSGSASNNYKGTTVSGSISRNYWTDNTAGSKPTITDGKNSKFSISGNSGTAGTGNSITETKLQYKLGSGSWVTCSGNSLSATAITCDDDVASQTVKARTRYKCSKGGNSDGYIFSEEASATIKNYEEPALPETAPSVTYNKSRFTIKENWVCKWDGTGQQATAANTSSALKGYRVVLLKNGSSVPIVDSAGKTISSNPSEPTWHTIDVAASTKTFTIYPAKNGFLPGNTMRIGIKPYSEDGNGRQLFNDAYKYSASKTVQNAGIMRVCTAKATTTKGATWKEGQVMIYINDTKKWVEADVVKVRTSTSAWSEST
jgi:hypothetical protein